VTPPQAAHLRLMSKLPVRTHRWTAPAMVEQGCKRNEEEQASLKSLLRNLEAQGKSRREMRLELRLGDKTIQRLLGPGKQGWPKGRPRK